MNKQPIAIRDVLALLNQHPDAGVLQQSGSFRQWMAEEINARFVDVGGLANKNSNIDSWDKIIVDRDLYHNTADLLAEAIGKYFHQDTGEHSNNNCPWNSALRIIHAAAERNPVQPVALIASIKELGEYLEGDCDERLSISQGESVALVLSELKRLMALNVVTADEIKSKSDDFKSWLPGKLTRTESEIKLSEIFFNIRSTREDGNIYDTLIQFMRATGLSGQSLQCEPTKEMIDAGASGIEYILPGLVCESYSKLASKCWIEMVFRRPAPPPEGERLAEGLILKTWCASFSRPPICPSPEVQGVSHYEERPDGTVTQVGQSDGPIHGKSAIDPNENWEDPDFGIFLEKYNTQKIASEELVNFVFSVNEVIKFDGGCKLDPYPTAIQRAKIIAAVQCAISSCQDMHKTIKSLQKKLIDNGISLEDVPIKSNKPKRKFGFILADILETYGTEKYLEGGPNSEKWHSLHAEINDFFTGVVA